MVTPMAGRAAQLLGKTPDRCMELGQFCRRDLNRTAALPDPRVEGARRNHIGTVEQREQRYLRRRDEIMVDALRRATDGVAHVVRNSVHVARSRHLIARRPGLQLRLSAGRKL